MVGQHFTCDLVTCVLNRCKRTVSGWFLPRWSTVVIETLKPKNELLPFSSTGEAFKVVVDKLIANTDYMIIGRCWNVAYIGRAKTDFFVNA